MERRKDEGNRNKNGTSEGRGIEGRNRKEMEKKA